MDRLGYTWYPKDFISDPDVMMMDSSERGIYRDLIDLAFLTENKIEYSLEKLSKYCNDEQDKILKVLQFKGKKIDDYWTIPSCQKRIDKANVNRANGKNGGRPKKPKQNPTITQPKTETKPNSKGKEKEKGKKKENKDVKKDFDFDVYLEKINELFGKNLRVVNSQAKQSIKARLKEGYTGQSIWYSMLNVANDKWHKDNNYQYCTPQYFAQVKTLDMHSSKPKQKPNEIGSHTDFYLHD